MSETTAPTDPPPTALVLFGATGDLAARMVLPAVAALAARDLLPQRWLLVGNGRGDQGDEEFRDHVREVLDPTAEGAVLDEAAFADFAGHLRFAGGGFSVDDPGALPGVLAAAVEELGEGAQVVHYLALPPSAFLPYTRALADHDLVAGARVVFEKPYGASEEGFHELDELVLSVFEEEQVFRIDHFLGKEATQQLHVLRFANRWIEQLWCADAVEQVQIDVPETLDVADRAGFYDETGATLDMLVTHLLQVAAEVAMERPAGTEPHQLVAAREEVLAAFRPLDPAEVVLGQVEGYQELDDVSDDSTTDTFTAARLWVDTDRWRGVPFLLRSGKQLADSAQRVSLVLRAPGDPVPGAEPGGAEPGGAGQGGAGRRAQALTLDLSGSGALSIDVAARRPGGGGELVDGVLALGLPDLPDAEPLPPYATLLRDVLLGERALFTGSTGLDQTWRIAGPVLTARPPVQPYAVGSWGPAAAQDLPGGAGWLAQRG